METDVRVAWIGAAVALAVAILSAIAGVIAASSAHRHGRELEDLRHQREEELRRQTEEQEASAVIEGIRRPLLASAVELKRRLGNILTNDFLRYTSGNDHRSRVALRSTLYRFAAYLGWRESLARQLTYLKYPSSDDTREVLELLENVATKLATDSLDWIDDSPRLMLWKDEQRAIGGLMQAPSAAGVIGYETFDNDYESRFSPWFDPFAADLLIPGIEHGTRLQAVSDSLDVLISKLDEERAYEGRV